MVTKTELEKGLNEISLRVQQTTNEINRLQDSLVKLRQQFIYLKGKLDLFNELNKEGENGRQQSDGVEDNRNDSSLTNGSRDIDVRNDELLQTNPSESGTIQLPADEDRGDPGGSESE